MCSMKSALRPAGGHVGGVHRRPRLYRRRSRHFPPNWTEHAATPAEIARHQIRQLKQWWASFNDPTLDRLVDLALTGIVVVNLS